jgi:NAD(P)-dependent dehydrogenase (short-subunit alcohol dehydrogenase family)
MKDLEGKVAFITGGGSGVGLGQAKIFVREGMKVGIADIRQDHLDEALAHFNSVPGARVHGVRLDITDRSAYARAADEVEQALGPVQLLCNTAGVSQFGPLQQATYDDWDWQLDVNLRGVINGIQTFVPRMLARGQEAHIVNTASMSAFVALPGTGIYCTTKMAIRGLTECLRMDLAPTPIGVSLLCPGAVNTNIHEAMLTRPEKYGKTGYYGNDPEVFKRLKDVISIGLEPTRLAEHVLAGVRANALYILPYPEFRETLESIHQRVMTALAKPEDDPELQKRLQRGVPGSGDPEKFRSSVTRDPPETR